MVTKIINLDLRDPNVVQRIEVSRLDSGLRAFEFHLYDGDLIYVIPDNVSITIQGTKPDRNGFTYACTYTQATGVVHADCTEQMTAVVGEVICQLVLVDTDNKRIASFIFILHVNRNATDDNTVYSDSDLAFASQVLNELQNVESYKIYLNRLAVRVGATENRLNSMSIIYDSENESIDVNNI